MHTHLQVERALRRHDRKARVLNGGGGELGRGEAAAKHLGLGAGVDAQNVLDTNRRVLGGGRVRLGPVNARRVPREPDAALMGMER